MKPTLLALRLGDLVPLQVLGRVTNEMTIGEMRQLLAHDPLTFDEEHYDLLIRGGTIVTATGSTTWFCRSGRPVASWTSKPTSTTAT